MFFGQREGIPDLHVYFIHHHMCVYEGITVIQRPSSKSERRQKVSSEGKQFPSLLNDAQALNGHFFVGQCFLRLDRITNGPS